MKKKILFIVNDFLPTPTANGICILNICKLLTKDYDVNVMCLYSDKKQPSFEIIDNIGIYRVYYRNRNLRLMNHRLITKLAKMEKLIVDVFSEKSIDMKLTISFRENIKKICLTEKIDVIIPVCFPFESIFAIDEEIRLNSKVIPFLIDNFSESESRHRFEMNKKLKMKKNKKIEEDTLNCFQDVIATTDWKNRLGSFKKTKFNLIFVGLPVLKFSQSNLVRSVKEDSKKFIFAGTLSKNRPIDILLPFLEYCLKKDSTIKFHFFVTGSKKQIKLLEKSSNNYPNNIIVKSFIPQEELQKEYSKADYLLSLGNLQSNQTPSKIFDYLSKLKPIVHFYYNDMDPIKNIIGFDSNYLLLNSYDSDEYNFNEISSFFTKEKESISKKDIEKKYFYALPETVTRQIRNLF